MATDSRDTFSRITDVLSQSLKKAFKEVCPERYGAALRLRRTDDPSSPQTVSFTINGPESFSVEIHVTITHVGGNVYDIDAQVEDGPARCFTYSEPYTSGSSLSIAPYLGKKIARHVLDEVEKQIGKQILRDRIEAS